MDKLWFAVVAALIVAVVFTLFGVGFKLGAGSARLKAMEQCAEWHSVCQCIPDYPHG